MSSCIASWPADPNPADRSALYGLVALAFRYPSLEIFESLRNGSLAAELGDRVSRLPQLAPFLGEVPGRIPPEMESEIEGVAYRELEAGFVRTFDAGKPAPPCPPYEHCYREGNPGNVLVEVSEFYKHFGLAVDQEEGRRELPDHLCAELEFLHFLSFKEAQAQEEGAAELLEGYRLAQKDFLKRHLAHWVPQLCDRLAEKSPFLFYAWLGRITAGLVASDLAWVEGACRQEAEAC